MPLPLQLSPAFSDNAALVIAYARRGRTWGHMLGATTMASLVDNPEQYFSQNVVKVIRRRGEKISAKLEAAAVGLPKFVVGTPPANKARTKVPHRKGAGKTRHNVRRRAA